jgi:hypothetical protein
MDDLPRRGPLHSRDALGRDEGCVCARCAAPRLTRAQSSCRRTRSTSRRTTRSASCPTTAARATTCATVCAPCPPRASRADGRAPVWSNFEIADLDFWRGQAYTDYFSFLDQRGGFYYEVPLPSLPLTPHALTRAPQRCGDDAPVHSLAAALSCRKRALHWFAQIGYEHAPLNHCPEEPAFTRHGCRCGPAHSCAAGRGAVLRPRRRRSRRGRVPRVLQGAGRARGRRGAPARGSTLRPGACARGSPAARLAGSRACVAGGSGHASRARDAPWWTVLDRRSRGAIYLPIGGQSSPRRRWTPSVFERRCRGALSSRNAPVAYVASNRRQLDHRRTIAQSTWWMGGSDSAAECARVRVSSCSQRGCGGDKRRIHERSIARILSIGTS